MKEQFDRFEKRLTSGEKARLWDEIAARGPSARAHEAWWRQRWVWPTAATVAVAAVLAVILIKPAANIPRNAPIAMEMDRTRDQRNVDAPPRIEEAMRAPVLDGGGAASDVPAGMDPMQRSDSPHRGFLGEAPASKVEESQPAASPAAPGGVEGQASVTAPVKASRAAGASTDLVADASPVKSNVEPLAGVIEGTVTDSTGAPLPYANVILVGTNWGAMTDEHGRYRIEELPAGTYTLTAMLLGFNSVSDDSIVVGGDLAAAVDFRMKEKNVGTLPEVEVSAAREVIRKKEASVSHATAARDVVQRPVGALDQLRDLKAGVIAKGEEIHFRGGREGKVQYESPSADASTSAEASKKPVDSQAWGGIKSMYDGDRGRDKKRNPAASPSATNSAPASPAVPPSQSVNVYGGSTLPNDEKVDAMFFQHSGVNPLIPTEEDRFSTFAVDVDNAAYTMARLYLQQGNLPPAEAVRLEECVNFFKQDYPVVQNDDFRIFMDAAPAPFANGYELLRVGIAARAIDPEERKPADLVFVVDVSGSMEREDRLEAVKQALGYLLDHLREGDRVAIVSYGNTAQVELEATDASNVSRIRQAVDELHITGATNAEAGINLGYDLARQMRREGRITRILLCSDGVANVGATGPESILSRVREEADKGIQLTTIGFGMGNYNDILMERLADDGDGSYYYVDNLKEAKRVFVENLTGTLQTLGRDAKIQVEFDPEQVKYYRLLGFENRDVRDEDFRNDAIDAGEIGAGHVVTALYELKLEDGARRGPLATVRFRYDRPDSPAGEPSVREIASTFDVSEIGRSFDSASARLRLDAAVAEYAEILRGSFYAKEGSFEAILPIARECARELRDDDSVAEFVTLVEKARDLWRLRPTPEPAGPPAVER